MAETSANRHVIHRILFGAATTSLVLIAAWLFVRHASSATDENIFTTSPSSCFVRTNVPATSAPLYGVERRNMRTQDTLHSGNLIAAVSGKKLTSLNDWKRALAAIPFDSSFTLTVFLPLENRYVALQVRRSSIPDSLVREIPPTVAVTSVVPGGASDRAGMKVGDLIYRINDESFANDQEADRILRQGQSGVATRYDVIRDGVSLSLAVTLVRFGFTLNNLIFMIIGVIYIGVGVFVGMSAHRFTAGRLLGWWFLLLGFFLTIVTLTRDPGPDVFTDIRNVVVMLSGFLSLSSGVHANTYFPAGRSPVPWMKKLIWVLYAAAAASPLLLLTKIGQMTAVVISILAIMLVGLFFYVGKREGPEEKKIRLVVKLACLAGVVGTLGGIVVLSLFWQGTLRSISGLPLLLIPAAYLFVIGRYRLFDLDLRVRRNVQYTILSVIWDLLLAVCLVALVLWISTIELSLPGITFTGTAIEIGGTSQADGTQRQILEKVLGIVAGVIGWYALWRLRNAGQSFLDKKYFRTQFDYRRAAGEMSEVLVRKLGMQELARGTADLLVDLMKVKRAGIFVFDDKGVCCCHESTGDASGSAEVNNCPNLDAGLITVLSTFKSAVRAEYLPDQWKALLQKHDFRSVMPIHSKERLSALLLLGEKMSETPLDEDDLAFLDAAVKQMSVSIENSFLYEERTERERMKHELDIARRIQLGSLPSQTPDVPGLDIAGASVPALEVGGDFFDYLKSNGDIISVIIGDVSGKGTSAALYMSKIQGILRSLNAFGVSPHELLSRANNLLWPDLEPNAFVTALVAAFHADQRTVTLVRAGHLPLYLYRSISGTVEQITPKGMGLGLADGEAFTSELEEKQIDVATGDVMLFISDGVTEAQNDLGEEFGETRLMELLQRLADQGAQAIRDRVLESVATFAGQTDQHDDQTIVVVKHR